MSTGIKELPLFEADKKAKEYFEYLKSVGLTPDQYQEEYQHEKVPPFIKS